MKELRRGDTGPEVRELQEWLTLHRCPVRPIGGPFGSATEMAVRFFQGRNGINPTGVVDEETWNALLDPLRFPKVSGSLWTLGTLAVEYGLIAWERGAREVGGQNCGPWVRLFMGSDGSWAKWCAGFTSWCQKQSALSLGIHTVPIPRTFDCDVIAGHAAAADLLLRGDVGQAVKPERGWLFLLRRKRASGADDWYHVGLVAEVGDGCFRTVEGNSNDEGSAEGVEVASVHRGITPNVDFVRIE